MFSPIVLLVWQLIGNVSGNLFFNWNLITVFDLISGLFAYVILGQKNCPNFFFKSFMYFVCVFPGCKTLLPKIVACEDRL